MAKEFSPITKNLRARVPDFVVLASKNGAELGHLTDGVEITLDRQRKAIKDIERYVVNSVYCMTVLAATTALVHSLVGTPSNEIVSNKAGVFVGKTILWTWFFPGVGVSMKPLESAVREWWVEQ
jgi:hypothetical protein